MGTWVGEDVPIDERQLQIGEIVGALSRRYVNQASNQSVLLVFVCGRPGAIGAHTPEVCYEGAGFTMNSAPWHQPIDHEGGRSDFMFGVATRPPPRLEHLRILWGWSADGATWQAPENPRIAFAKAPYLYKVYAVRGINDPNAPVTPNDPAIQLLKELLPRIKVALSPV